ncbi:MAG: mucoidy inhibitor MuiA family protein [Deltaproteobacteria bacterium]|nr:mucoidy inhibitor MuiA family protein [Deltaproteobacteria bacterium]
MIALLTSLLAPLALAEQVEVTVPPSQVTVYAGQARVARVAQVRVGAGEHEVRFHGLPSNTLPDTLSADVRGKAKILGVDYQRVTATQIADARVRELDAALLVLRDRQQDLQDQAAAQELELSGLDASREAAVRQLSAQLLVADQAPRRVAELRQRLVPEERRVLDARLETRRKLRDLEQEMAALLRERGGLGAAVSDTWDAVVHLQTAAPADLEVELIGMVVGARWEPRYDIRANADTGAVELSLSAMVAQSTGEDWGQVALSVSSARPGQGTEVPRLDPYWLHRPVVVSRSSKRSAPSAPKMAFAEAASGAMYDEAPAPMELMEEVVAEVEVALSATTFTVARKEDITSTGEERKVLLTTQALQAELREVIVPRIDPHAWLVGELVNTAEFPLLAGQAGVFLSGAYLGDTVLDTVPPGDAFDVAFGVDDRVHVARKPREIRRDEVRTGGRRSVSRWEWSVAMENRRARPVAVELWEQVPVSRSAEVEITLTGATVEPVHEPEGLLRFELTLAPRQQQTLDWGYQVVLPADTSARWME